MLAFGINGLNMNDDKRFFDITFEQRTLVNQSFVREDDRYLRFSSCKKQHWAKIGS